MISMDKKYVTAGNRYPVRIYALDGDLPSCVHGAIFMGDAWRYASWGANGMYWGESKPDSLDLVEVKEPERIKWWTNVYSCDDICGAYETKEVATSACNKESIRAHVGIELLIHDDGRKEAKIIEVV